MAVTNPIDVWPKDPTAVLDYTIDWTEWLGFDALTNVLWTVPSGIVSAGSFSSQSTTTVWLSGGTGGTSYLVSCSVTTSSGRMDKRTVQINVGDR